MALRITFKMINNYLYWCPKGLSLPYHYCHSTMRQTVTFDIFCKLNIILTKKNWQATSSQNSCCILFIFATCTIEQSLIFGAYSGSRNQPTGVCSMNRRISLEYMRSDASSSQVTFLHFIRDYTNNLLDLIYSSRWKGVHIL